MLGERIFERPAGNDVAAVLLDEYLEDQGEAKPSGEALGEGEPPSETC